MSTPLYQTYANRTPTNGYAFHLLAKGGGGGEKVKRVAV
jgi:hypothetical protein